MPRAAFLEHQLLSVIDREGNAKERGIQQELIENLRGKKAKKRDFPGPFDLGVKNLPCNAGDIGSIPDWGTEIQHAME